MTSTPAQNEFDLVAFCVAIEQQDVPTQLRCYAANAEVRLTSLEEPSLAPHTLLGGADIEVWIQDRCADHDVTYQVIYHWMEDDQVMLTEECRRPDGTTALTASTAHITNGHITTQSVVLIHTT